MIEIARLTQIVQVRLPKELVDNLEGLSWAEDRSNAIRMILESFFLVSESERVNLLKAALETRVTKVVK